MALKLNGVSEGHPFGMRLVVSLGREEAKMLDQYQGTLLCKVNYNDGAFAECDIVDAVSTNPEASIDDQFWLGPSRVQVHAEMLGLDEEEFLTQYAVGKTFQMELTVRVIREETAAEVSAQNRRRTAK